VDGARLREARTLFARAIASEESLRVFGDDYDTPDGSCIRDYIHLADLVEAHVQGLKKDAAGVFNLGTQRGTSVLELARAFAANTDMEVGTTIETRRSGDAARAVARAHKARQELGWEPRYSLDDMVTSTLDTYKT